MSKADIDKYYETFNLTNVKDKKNIENELLYQMYKQPRDKVKTKMEPVAKNDTHQYDLLFLPEDKGYRYCLVGVDVGSRLCDAQAIKNKEAKTVLAGVQKIYNRGVLSQPLNIRVDDGSEFKGEFAKYFKNKGVIVSVAQPNRHRQVGLVESRNKSIGTYLLKRMVAQEVRTNEPSTEWLEYLQPFIKKINKRFEVKKPEPNKDDNPDDFIVDRPLLDVGDKVRYALDRPTDLQTGKAIDSKFRAGDPRFSREPVEIVDLKVGTMNPPLYGLKGKRAMYTRGQLIPVKAEAELPPDKTQSKFTVEEIVGKKTIKGKVNYEVKWKDQKEHTFEQRKNLLEDGLKEEIDKYELKIKTKKK